MCTKIPALPGMHPAVQRVSFLVGTWRGEGRGDYPTIEPFRYVEEVEFVSMGKPFLVYSQRTFSPSGVPMHTETGYLRCPPTKPSAVELVVADPTGVTTVFEGTVKERTLTFESTSVSLTSTAKPVKSITRSLALQDGWLICDASMAAMGKPMEHHLHAELIRPGDARSRSGEVLVDIRGANEIAAGMIPGAKHIPMNVLLADAEQCNALPHERLLIYCQGGMRSERTLAKLRELGFGGRVRHVEGGYQAWAAAHPRSEETE